MTCTLQEIETHWSFDDLMMANDVLNMIEAGEARAKREAGQTSG